MQTAIDNHLMAINATIEAMSIYQKIGGTIFLAMTVVFFAWILYLMITK